jgi:splicing factor 3B subunit 3
MIASVDKQKLVYVMNRDLSNKLTISSPLEAHKTETLLFSVVGIDVDFENPVFAMIELDYSEIDQDPTGEAYSESEKKLAYYELDLGLNHVIRKWSEPISRTANFLLAVPGGTSGPSGVLICGENWISYKHQGHQEIRAPLPRRHNLPEERGTLLTTGCMFKTKDTFFFLVQSEYGDLYKVTLDLGQNDGEIVVNDVFVSFFDTIQPANAICLTRKGLLFVASEFGNHSVIQIQDIDDSNAVKAHKLEDAVNEELGDDSVSASKVAPLFEATERLQNLAIVENIPSFAPLVDMLVTDLHDEDASQIYALCGRGNRSTLRTLRHGVSVQELASLDFPEKPTGVWTLKRTADDVLDRFIVVSFTNKTIVFAVGDSLEETNDSGLDLLTATLSVMLLSDNSYVQVHTNGFRHVTADGRTMDWKAPVRRFVRYASVNARQLALVIGGREIVYFELNAIGQLSEVSRTDMDDDVTCIDVGVVPEGRARSMFMAVGCYNQRVCLLSLDIGTMLQRNAPHGTDKPPSSVCLIEMARDTFYDEGDNVAGSGGRPSANQQHSGEQRSLYLHIGMEGGRIERLAVDAVSGDLSDSRPRFLGAKPIRFLRIHVEGSRQQPAVMALTSRAWLCYNYQSRYRQDPLIFDSLDYISDFSYADNPYGLAAISGRSLKLMSLEHLGQMFHESSAPLRYTPKRFVHIPGSRDLVIVEADHNEYNEVEKARLSSSSTAAANSNGDGMNVDEADPSTTVQIRGPVPPNPNKWASCVRIFDVKRNITKSVLELSVNEAAVSVTTVCFRQHSEEIFLIVGTVKDLQQHPKKFSSCALHVYRSLDDGQVLQLVHQTEIEDIPYAMVEFQGKLLVGVGRHLRLYDMGKKKLLKKSENKSFPTAIVRLQVMGDRIFVGDISQSVVYVKYRPQENTLGIFADDTLPRYITCMCAVDYNTVACGDKFGNVFVLRLPESANDELQITGTAANIWDQGLASGAPNKVDVIAHYFLGELPTAMSFNQMKYEGNKVLMVSTITGGLHALIPTRLKTETQVFQQLEMFMRQEYHSLCRRDHMSYRSYYAPVKNVIDISLCERYMQLPVSKQRDFAEGVDLTPTVIVKKLEEIRDFV